MRIFEEKNDFAFNRESQFKQNVLNDKIINQIEWIFAMMIAEHNT